VTHKDFMAEVQRRSGLDRSCCAALMQAAVKMMAEQATEQIAVEWEGIGQFIATKHPEYVQEDADSGLQTMYPPRITYRLQSEAEL
jgi:nucleoid DNA-binding protein